MKFSRLLRGALISRKNNHMGHNFRSYGASFGAYDFDAFVNMAQRFYEDAMRAKDAGYSIIEMPRGRVAIDKDGEIRGVFDQRGNPLAFFRPSFRNFGFSSKEEELKSFRAGENILFN
jgi:pyocin large subunit-like protein